METSIRDELHKIIDEANDAHLQEIYDWLHEGPPVGIQYATSELEMFYSRIEEHAQRNRASYTTEDFLELFAIKRPDAIYAYY